jgi:tripartite-type tricarboxylate transporter receptor subunit TctC
MSIRRVAGAVYLGTACLSVVISGVAWPAWAADSYPNHPVRFIVPYPPGGPTDLVARGIAEKLSSAWGQQFIVDNRGGASTMIGAETVAKAAPDGYTIGLVTQTTMSINPHAMKKLTYDPVKDFAPITQVVNNPYMIAANVSTPFSDIKGLIAQAKARPGAISYATPGNGSTNHLGGVLLERMAGIKLLHVPFKGAAQGTTAVMAGEVDLVITAAIAVAPHVKAGRLKFIAFADEKRHPSYPDVPSTGEAGLKGYHAGTWLGIVTRGGVAREIVTALNNRIIQALNDPDLRSRLTSAGFDIVTQSPEAFARMMTEDRALVGKIIEDGNVKFD